jgi:STAS-like domain of unknown function (DUF4325)
MVVLHLADIVGSLCCNVADGQKVNVLVEHFLNQGQSVQLDFHKVGLVTPSFYAAAIGDLICHFPEEFVSDHVTLSGLPLPNP